MKVKFKDLNMGEIIKVNGKYAIKCDSKTLLMQSDKTERIEVEPEQEFEIEDNNDNTTN